MHDRQPHAHTSILFGVRLIQLGEGFKDLIEPVFSMPIPVSVISMINALLAGW